MDEETPQTFDVTADALSRAVAGSFRLDREIGRGGMGVVYRAHDEQLQREVAIKTLPPHLAADAQIRARFLREARTAAALSHPNIVPIYAAAERDGVVYFVMGLVSGESLAERIARTGPLAPVDVVSLLRELCDALGFAHAHGIVHRDVKAENVLLDRVTGRAMVTDFGIARVAETAPLTATGAVLGTVQYMSPEQVSGDTLDGRSDLYSLGVLAFFALTGRFPFERPSASAIVVAHVNAIPPTVRSINPRVPPKLDELVSRLLEKSPARRFDDADALRQALVPQILDGAYDPSIAGRAVVSRSSSDVMSSTDAQQVWSRAAELQANTGMVTPPASFAPRSSQPLVTQGVNVAVVRDAAVEAGIDAKYVDKALGERAAMVPVVVEPGELMLNRPNWFLGSRYKLEYGATIDGELGSVGDGHHRHHDALMVEVSHDGFEERVAKIAKQIKNTSNSAENVAYSSGDAASVVEMWLKSKGHRKNIEGAYTISGIGMAKAADGTLYYTQIFIKSK